VAEYGASYFIMPHNTLFFYKGVVFSSPGRMFLFFWWYFSDSIGQLTITAA